MARSHRRCVLAVLAMAPGRPVASDTLIDRVWGERPPREALHSLHTHISAIRRLIEHNGDGVEDAALRRVGSGYVLEIDPDRIDVHRSRRLAERARTLAAGDGSDRDAHSVELLREACSLWRGTPLASLTAEWASQVRDGLEQEKLTLFIDRYTVELRLGEHGAALGPLAELLAEHPLVEPLARLQMLALYRSGWQADALNCYTRIRQRLVDELGDEPGAELRNLHEQVLRRDPALDIGPAEATGESITAEGPGWVRPAQLPADIAAFAGRVHELQALDTFISADHEQQPAAVTVSAIGGAAGIGKTSLAVRWAHRVADRFPDGHLYANLAGYGPDARPRDPIDVVKSFLEALQVPPERTPRTPDAQIGMYRSLLNGRRMLIVLDNARNADQIRPLLPGGTGCFVLVTSRSQLSSLVATEGAHMLSLDRLTPSEARQLLEGRLGADWISAEPEATDEIITRCGRLPLALAVVAARAKASRALAASDLAAALRESDGALDLLSGPDAMTDLRAVMSWSYRTLSAEAARLYRLVGLWPGPEFSEAAIVALAGVPIREVRRLLAELTQAHLINEHATGRFGIHDLLREYAAEMVRDHDTEVVRDGATQRVLDFYVHTACRAARRLNPQREPIELHAPLPDVSPVDFDDQQEALVWLNLEYPTLRAWLTYASRTRSLTHTWQLAWATPDFLQRQGRWSEWADNQELALDAAERLGDPLAEAFACRSLARAYGALGQYDDAHRHLARAVDCFAELGHRLEQARTWLNVSVILNYQDRFGEALTHTTKALALFEEHGDVGGQAYSHNGMGWLHLQLGRHDQALSHCHRALTLQQKVDDKLGQAATWDTIGYAYHHLGEYRAAIAAYERSIDLVQAHGDRFREADVSSRLGDTLYATGDGESARRHWSLSVELFDQLQRPEAADVRAKLLPNV